MTGTGAKTVASRRGLDLLAAPDSQTRRAAKSPRLGRMQGSQGDPSAVTVAAAVLDEASRAGLLEGATEHISFRAPRALLDAARKETGLASTTELGLVALAILARPDPVSEAMKRTRGRLGKQHTLEH